MTAAGIAALRRAIEAAKQALADAQANLDVLIVLLEGEGA